MMIVEMEMVENRRAREWVVIKSLEYGK